MSELTYSYTSADGEKKTLKASEMPEELLAKLEEAARTVANGGTTTAQGVTPAGGTHQLGDKGDWVTINLQDFIKGDTDLDSKVLDNSELRSITSLTVSFSGGVGFVKSQPTSYPVKDAIAIPESAITALTYTAGTPNPDGSIPYTYTPATGSITSVVQTYTDDEGNTVTKYQFKDGSGNVIQAQNESGTMVDAGSLYGEAIMKLLGMGTEGDKVNSYTTDTPQTSTTAIPKEYKLTLLGMLDNDMNEVDISALANNGTTSWDLVFNKADGQFSYVGTAGNETFTVNLSAINDKFENLTVDISGTQDVGNEKKTALSGNKLDGYKVGKMTGVTIGTDGLIKALYSNGVQQNLGQICVATFPNAMGLENAGDNLYQVTASSGDVNIVDIKASGTGSITTGVLEMSNVDLSQQFTDMITTQRGFQANSRIITVSDTLLEELVNLKR
ncbi:MAG: flagellar hook-basal body complex protein [Lachnospiraceae bacterium]|nr:flagellar hook-basal body complex protein [Lachnospiraceae bacterium]